MNLKYGQDLSINELMERNRSPHMRKVEPRQSTQEPETTPAPIQQPTPQPIVIQCKVPAELKLLAESIYDLEDRCSGMETKINMLTTQCSHLATQSQVEELLKVAKHLEQMVEQAGKKKEQRFSLLKFRLPRLHLSLPEWDWPTVVTVVMALAMAVLLLLWFKLGGDWSGLSLLSR